jgi:hypothetical protein
VGRGRVTVVNDPKGAIREWDGLRLLGAKEYCVAEVWRRLLEGAEATPDSADCFFADPASNFMERIVCLFSFASQPAKNYCRLRISERIDEGAG